MKRLGSSRPATLDHVARYNVAPTQSVLAIINDLDRTARELRWGLVPYWARSPAAQKLSTFNARVETIATAPTYRHSTRFKRCVVTADGFFEWRRNADGTKTPYWIHRDDLEPYVFAGLWDEWRSRDSDVVIASCTIITAPANAFMQQVHSRMPIILDEDNAREWLNADELEPQKGLDLLVPAETFGRWVMHPVSLRVGNVRNDDATLIEPVDLTSHAVQLPLV